MGNIGAYWANDGTRKNADTSKFNFGSIWRQEHIYDTLPILPNGMDWKRIYPDDRSERDIRFWELVKVRGTAYREGAEMFIPYGTEGLPPKIDNPNLYWEQINHNETGRTFIVRERNTIGTGYTVEQYETLRKQYSDAAIAAEKAKDESRKLRRVADDYQEEYSKEVKLNERLQEANSNMKGELETLYEGNRKLMNENTETKKPGRTPEYVEYESLQKERMRLENESLKLDNDRKEAEFKGYKDYPHSVWRTAQSEIQNISDKVYLRVAAIWVAIVALGINEVIQWLTR